MGVSVERRTLHDGRVYAERVFFPVFPVDEQQDELLQSEGFHIGMVDDIKTEVKKCLVRRGVRFQQCADVQFEFVEHWFVDVSVGVDEVAEELILLDGFEVLFADVNATSA